MNRLTFYKTQAKKALQILGLIIVVPFIATFIAVVIYRFVPVTDTPYMRVMAAKNGVDVNQKWVPLSKISSALPLAVVSSEDNLFTKHNGFSWTAIKTAFAHNSEGKRIHGGSTISQQTAKNVFLWNGRSWIRKAIEAPITVMIELVWGKERIMEVYLNIIEFGPGTYGAEAAAQKYFHHSAARLTREEAALMVSVMPNPVKMKIAAPSPYVVKRQAHILSLMRKIGRVNYTPDEK